MVEGNGLENRRGCKLFVGSNPTLSARPRFCIAGTDEEPVGPALELQWLLQVAQAPPDIEVRLLGGIAGQMADAQDAVGHFEQA